MEVKLEDEILQEIDTISEEMMAGIKKIVRIKSVKDKKTGDAPYGVGVKEALVETLELARSLGFTTSNIDNHIGYATYGTGDEYVCALGHLDVVEEGVGWIQPPYSAHEENGLIYGRGILDNKGPILACLYALYALKRIGIPLKKEVRIIFGCDEESGFEDIKYYLTKEKPPIMGFTPDCKYPVVYAERGRLLLQVEGNKDNMHEFFTFLNDFILNSNRNGDAFKIQMSGDTLGALEVKHYKVYMEDNPYLHMAISYPSGIEYSALCSQVRASVPHLLVSVVQNFDPVFFDTDAPLIARLQKAYELVTHMDGTPVTTTGGTYAKIMPNIVPFGPSFPGQKGIGHQPNEWMSREDIIANAKIYALSLYYLSR